MCHCVQLSIIYAEMSRTMIFLHQNNRWCPRTGLLSLPSMSSCCTVGIRCAGCLIVGTFPVSIWCCNSSVCPISPESSAKTSACCKSTVYNVHAMLINVKPSAATSVACHSNCCLNNWCIPLRSRVVSTDISNQNCITFFDRIWLSHSCSFMNCHTFWWY